jgi:hypothetical protein
VSQTSFSGFFPEVTLRNATYGHNVSSSRAWSSEATTSVHNVKSKCESSRRNPTVFAVRQLFELYQAGRLFCEDVPEAQLKAAFFEASRILNSGIFPEYIKPQIGIDDCGEFSFSIKNLYGYLDIGVSGEGQISYHVRNDADPSKTTFNDCEWDGLNMPEQLIACAVQILRE